MEKIFDKYAHDMLYHDSDGSNYPCRMVNIDNFQLAAAEIELIAKIEMLQTTLDFMNEYGYESLPKRYIAEEIERKNLQITDSEVGK